MKSKMLKKPTHGWRSKPLTAEAVATWRGNPNTRQRRRAEARQKAWANWRCYPDGSGIIETAPRDDNGVMRRRTRRLISRAIAKRAFTEASKPLPQMK